MCSLWHFILHMGGVCIKLGRVWLISKRSHVSASPPQPAPSPRTGVGGSAEKGPMARIYLPATAYPGVLSGVQFHPPGSPRGHQRAPGRPVSSQASAQNLQGLPSHSQYQQSHHHRGAEGPTCGPPPALFPLTLPLTPHPWSPGVVLNAI